MYNTVIFDLDGTLLDTIEDLADSVNYVQKKYGYPLHSVDEVKAHVGNGIRNLIIRSIPKGEEKDNFQDVYKEFKRYYQKHCRVKTDVYSGIMELLESLHKRKIKMAIVSNKAHCAVEELNEAYFKNYISVAIGENEEAGIKKKPSPDSVFKVLDMLGSKKEETVYVGDSDVDMATAKNSGLDCILCSWGFREKALLESLKPLAVIDNPEELLEIIL